MGVWLQWLQAPRSHLHAMTLLLHNINVAAVCCDTRWQVELAITASLLSEGVVPREICPKYDNAMIHDAHSAKLAPAVLHLQPALRWPVS